MLARLTGVAASMQQSGFTMPDNRPTGDQHALESGTMGKRPRLSSSFSTATPLWGLCCPISLALALGPAAWPPGRLAAWGLRTTGVDPIPCWVAAGQPSTSSRGIPNSEHPPGLHKAASAKAFCPEGRSILRASKAQRFSALTGRATSDAAKSVHRKA